MGSRRGRHAALIAAACAAGCGVQPATSSVPMSAPASADRWAFPLVGPEEDGLLVAAVYVSGHGPLAFVIDLDARHSSIDESLARALHADVRTPQTEDDAVGLGKVVHDTRIVDGPTFVDALGQPHPSRQTEVAELRLGDFIVEHHTVSVVRDGAFDSDGRRILGKLGRDVFGDGLAFGFDRELGVGMVASTRHFTPPGDKLVVKTISRYDRDDQPLTRHLVDATVDGLAVRMHVELGATTSELRAQLWPRAHLQSIPVNTRRVDELGNERMRASGAIAAKLDASALHASTLLLTDYDDGRWRAADLDGSLGLDAFRASSVWVSWDLHGVFVTPRRDREATLAARVRRWADGRLSTCPHAGCVAITLHPAVLSAADQQARERQQRLSDNPLFVDLDGQPTPPPPALPLGVVHVARDEVANARGFDLDITFEATLADGTHQLYAASLSAAAAAIDAELDAVSVEVLDVGPLPRACPNHVACIRPVQRPR